MFDGVEHVAIASPNPPVPAQWYVDRLAQGERAAQKMFDPGLRRLHLIQRTRPLPE